MKTGRRKIYWDTAVLIAWLMNERVWPTDVLEGMQDVVLGIDSGQIILLTSTITRTEVFEGALTPKQREQYTLLMSKPSLQEISPAARVTARA